jgi:hypothetical protein
VNGCPTCGQSGNARSTVQSAISDILAIVRSLPECDEVRQSVESRVTVLSGELPRLIEWDFSDD